MKRKILAALTAVSLFVGAAVPTFAANTSEKTLTMKVNPAGAGSITYSVGEDTTLVDAVLDQAYTVTADTVTVKAAEKTGYRFSKWTAAGATFTNETTAQAEAALTGDAVLTANFDVKLTVTAPTNGSITVNGKAPTGSDYFAPGSDITVAASPAENYQFVNWTGASEATTATATFKMPTTPATIGAVFEAINTDPDKVTVTFRDGTIEAAEAQIIAKGGKAAKPADPKKDGYTFDGWYADADFKTAFDFNQVINADTVVYAKFTKNEEPVTPPADTGEIEDILNAIDENSKEELPQETADSLAEAAADLADKVDDSNIQTVDQDLLNKLDKIVENGQIPDLTTDQKIDGLKDVEEVSAVKTTGFGLNALALFNKYKKTGDEVNITLTVKAVPKKDKKFSKIKEPMMVLQMNLEVNGKTAQPSAPIKFTATVTDAKAKTDAKFVNIFSDKNVFQYALQITKQGPKAKAYWNGSDLHFYMNHFSQAVLSAENAKPTPSHSSSGGGGGFGGSYDYINDGYGVTVKANAGGKVSPLGITRVPYAKSFTVTVTPDPGYVVDKAIVDGVKEVSLTNGQYTFNAVTSPSSFEVIFKRTGAPITPTTPEKPSEPAAVAPNPSTGDSLFRFLF